MSLLVDKSVNRVVDWPSMVKEFACSDASFGREIDDATWFWS